jgi:hypothetical protein
MLPFSNKRIFSQGARALDSGLGLALGIALLGLAFTALCSGFDSFLGDTFLGSYFLSLLSICFSFSMNR